MSNGPPEAAPPPGWTNIDNVLKPDSTLTGAAVRDVDVVGICHCRDCRRRISVDLPHWISRGYGAMSLSDLARMLQCGRVDTPCGLSLPS